MFTGIIAQIGRVEYSKNGSLAIVVPLAFARGLKSGASVAVNGACLTVVKLKTPVVIFDVIQETLRRTNLGLLKRGSEVNLEKALRADGRFEGHVVLGHIDTVAKLKTDGQREMALTFEIPSTISRYFVCKGSVAVDGVSFTVVDAGKNFFTVSVIPYTLKNTIVKHYTKGTLVNVEVDIIGKYVAKTCRR